MNYQINVSISVIMSGWYTYAGDESDEVDPSSVAQRSSRLRDCCRTADFKNVFNTPSVGLFVPETHVRYPIIAKAKWKEGTHDLQDFFLPIGCLVVVDQVLGSQLLCDLELLVR